MTAKTEPTDGFLDRDFASFREARLRAKKAKTEDALEHRHAKIVDAEAPAPVTTEPPKDDAFFGTSTHERTSIRARTRDDRTTAMLEVMLEDLDGEVPATRSGPRVEATPAPTEPTTASVTPAPAPVTPDDDNTRAMARATPAAEDRSSDPEFERFRAARLVARPDSGRLRKPDARPDSGRLRKPDLEGHCSDPEFERFRAARQAGEAPPRRADSARLKKPDLGAPAPTAGGALIDALLAVTLPEAAAASEPVAPPVDAAPPAEPEKPEDLFFGTSVHERAVVRARVLGESPDPDAPAPRRAPPPPLPERPSD